MQRRLARIDDSLSEQHSFDRIIGRSESLRRAVELARKVAATDTSVLLTGETGTGKEVFAQAIHHASPRAREAFVAVNCSAFSKELLESELFGHVKGAFTGAVFSRRGLLEEAQGGTVFLDEIGELTLATQAKLLRAIQEHEIRPVGGNKPVTVNVRFITATNRNLQEDVTAGRFREDLYYRLNVLTIRLPSLRERPGDLPVLALHFLRRLGAASGRKHLVFSPECLESLTRYHWPGNVRELANAVERAIALTEGSVISRLDLPAAYVPSPAPRGSAPHGCATLRVQEREAISEVLRANGGNVRAAAQSLGIARSVLYRRLRRYGLTPDI